MDTDLNFWEDFPKTDPAYTKSTTEGGRKATSITPVYMVKLATDQLGPIGIGWGYKIIEERFDNTQPIILVNGDKAKGVPPQYMMDEGRIVWEKTHTVILEMWIGEKSNTFTQYGHTKYSYMTKKGSLYIDHEYGKKSVTDAMTKCLSLIGVCSDVYMGEFDSGDYVQLAKLENDLAKADKNDTVYIEKVEELRKYIKVQATQITLCPNIDSMQKIYNVANAKIVREAPLLNLVIEDERAALNDAYKENEAKIKGSENE